MESYIVSDFLCSNVHKVEHRLMSTCIDADVVVDIFIIVHVSSFH